LATQTDIARKCGLDVSSVNKILRKTGGPKFSEATVRKVFRAARDLGYNFERLKFAHTRDHPRLEVNRPVQMSIYRPDGSVFSSGQATIREVSLSGAILKGVILSKQVIPIAPHTIGIVFELGPAERLEVRGFPVRFFQDGESLGLSVKFVNADGVKKWMKMIS
jgi:transcriptional regulator with XRE-family HTH domain